MNQILKHPSFITSMIALVVTSYISFFLVFLNVGFNAQFIGIWLRSWIVAFILAVPSLWYVAPAIKQLLNSLNNTISCQIKN